MQVVPLLTSFTSALDRALPDAATEPTLQDLTGAVLFTDFAGFTPLTERLARSGPGGAEQLTEVLNWHYGILTDVVAAEGGDVLLFAGDALVALFTGDDAAVTAARAARSALAMQAALAAGTPPHGAKLGLRATIGVGTMTAQWVGGTDGRWITLVGGEAITSVFAADGVASPGQVIATAAAWRAIAPVADGEVMTGEGVAQVHGVGKAGSLGNAPNIPVDATKGKDASRLVLPLVRDRLLGGQSEFLAEFREATAIFARMSNVDPGIAADLPRLHAAALAAQEETARRDGALYQLLRDDKGCSLVLAFGLPGQAHDDDAARAADLAIALRERLSSLGIQCDIGIATGPVFCGAYGGSKRRNYGIIGPTMNRAARLMQKAAGGVLADLTTMQRGERWMDFAERDAVTVKGIATPLRVFAPVARRVAVGAGDGATHPAMIGRARELAEIDARVAALLDHGTGGAVLVEAEAGMGKSTLLRAALLAADARGVRRLEGAADSIEQSTAFLALRPMIATMLGLPGSATLADPASARATVDATLARLPGRLRELAPLLNVVLPLDLPDNELTAQMSGTIRAANLTDLLLALGEELVAAGPVLIALEDLHWMDDASLQFCARLLDAVPKILLVATFRPMTPVPPSIVRLGTGDGRETLELNTLAPDEIVELVRRRLGAETIPVAVKELILAKAEGNPFYSEEIALALREAGVITIAAGECSIVGDQELSSLKLPGTVKGVITSRIDRLPATAQVVIKVASVLGRTVELPVLSAVLPSSIDRSALPAALAELNAAELLSAEGRDGSRFAFRHALIQETTYNLLPFAQRRPLHAAAAEYVEHEFAADLMPYSARLAYHWSRAERPEKAVTYLGDAGRQALEAYANQSAVEFFSEAIKLDQQLRGPLTTDARRASWHRQLAEGHYSLIQWDQARTNYEAAIQLSGFPAPRFGVATPVEVLKHVTTRFAPRVVYRDPTSQPDDERAAGIEALRACENLQVVYLWQGNALSLAHTVFEGANIAARTGPSAESAFAQAMVGYLLAVAGLHSVAERDLRRAVAMADDSGQLLQRVSTKMYLGMTLTLLGRPHDGMPFLQEADDLVSRLGAGLWKHRGKYMLAEPHLMVGQLDEAADLFAACATISMSVEPPITGFANAMRALCWIRQGRIDDALGLIAGPTGIRLVRDNPIGLQLYNTLAALAEGHLWSGDWRAAFAAAEEGVAIPERGPDANSFFTGYNGHVAMARVFLTMIEWRATKAPGVDALPSADTLWALTTRALKNFRKGAKTFPGARSPLLVVEGLAHALRGRTAKAIEAWTECRRVADASDMPYESAMASYELGRHAPAGAARDAHLATARATFARLSMPRYAERCDVPDEPLHPFPNT